MDVTQRETENAKKLLAGSKVFASTSRDGFAAQYSTLNRIAVDRWDSLLAIAGTGTALLMIPSRYEPADQKELTSIVVATLAEWDETAVQQLAAFINFVTSEAKDSDGVPDAIGNWILRDIELSETEQSAPRVIGMMLMNTFGPWWDQ
jgi:hypothetical protein